MIGELLDELLTDHTGRAENTDVDSCVVHDDHDPKKNPPAFAGPAGVGTLLCLLSYATNAHTPGLRIRFVRFRQTIWCVEVIVTIARQYIGEAPLASNFSRNCTAIRDPQTERTGFKPSTAAGEPTPRASVCRSDERRL